MNSLPALHEIFDLPTSKLISLLSSTLPAKLREATNDAARNELQEYMEMVGEELNERQSTYDWIEREMHEKKSQPAMRQTTANDAPLIDARSIEKAMPQERHSEGSMSKVEARASNHAAAISTTTHHRSERTSPKRKREHVLAPQKPQLEPQPHPTTTTSTEATSPTNQQLLQQHSPSTPSPSNHRKLLLGKSAEISPISPSNESSNSPTNHKSLSVHSNFSSGTKYQQSIVSPSHKLEKKLKYEINKDVYQTPHMELPKTKLTDDFNRTVKAKVDTKVVKVTHLARGGSGGFFIINPNRLRREMLLKEKKKKLKKKVSKENVDVAKKSSSQRKTSTITATTKLPKKPAVPKRPSQSAPRTLNTGERHISNITSPVNQPNMLCTLNRSFSESKLMVHVQESVRKMEPEETEEIYTDESDAAQDMQDEAWADVAPQSALFDTSPLEQEVAITNSSEELLPKEDPEAELDASPCVDSETGITLHVPPQSIVTGSPGAHSDIAEEEIAAEINDPVDDEVSVADETEFDAPDLSIETEFQQNVSSITSKQPLMLVTPTRKTRRVLVNTTMLQTLSPAEESEQRRTSMIQHQLLDEEGNGKLQIPHIPESSSQNDSNSDNLESSDAESVESLALSEVDETAEDADEDKTSDVIKVDEIRSRGFREQIQEQMEQYGKRVRRTMEKHSASDDTSSSKSSTSQTDKTQYQEVTRSKKISIFERKLSRKQLYNLRETLLSRLSNEEAFQKRSPLTEADMHGEYFDKLRDQIQDLDPVFVLKFLDERCDKSFREAQRQLLDRCSAWKRIISEKVDYSHLYTSFYDIFTATHRSVIGSEVAAITNNRVKRSRSHVDHDHNYTVLLTKVLEQLDQWFIATPLESGQNHLYACVLNNRVEVYEIVTNATTANSGSRWLENPPHNDVWNLYWSWSKPQVDRHKLLIWQKINHFSNAKQLTSKEFLKRSIDRFIRVPGRKRDEFSIMPPTFALPHEYIKLVEMYAENDNRPWIVKPIGQSRGRGIRIVTDISRVDHNEHVVVQRYIENPLLLDGYKFDLRIYVLVTHFQPLEAFIYTDGFARFASEKFTLDTQSFKDVFIHLTNTSIQQKAMKGTQKILISELAERLNRMGYDWDSMFDRIITTIIKSLVCVEDLIAEPKHATEGPGFDVNSFELFGYDILLTNTCDCWLLEVNASPSMEKHDHIDSLKDMLIEDTMKVVDPIYFDRWALKCIIERRLRGKKVRSYRTSATHAQHELNDDLKAILHGRIPRMYGEEPAQLGDTKYRMIAPSAQYNKIRRLRK